MKSACIEMSSVYVPSPPNSLTNIPSISPPFTNFALFDFKSGSAD